MLTIHSISEAPPAQTDRPQQLHKRFDKFIDDAIWDKFTLREIKAIADDVFRDYEKFLERTKRFKQIG